MEFEVEASHSAKYKDITIFVIILCEYPKQVFFFDFLIKIFSFSLLQGRSK
jgi:hypothetical protein